MMTNHPKHVRPRRNRAYQDREWQMSIDTQTFRATLAHWATGVTIVTSIHDGQRVGITASSFCSVSLDPPRVLVCVAKRLHTHRVIEESQIFAVNILSSAQQEWGMRFAGLLPEAADRFTGIDIFAAETGCPLLPGVLGWLDCRLAAAYDGGDHTIYVGDVVAADAVAIGDPILYYHRQWRAMAATE
jgi:flavin reductase (DIM6/NTAB) family NADH-FMN oxidoreductase RutF